MRYLAERARALRSAREFFESRGYVEVETPIAVPSPGLDLHLDAFEVTSSVNLPRPQLGPRFLSTSPEYQMKRLLADERHHPRIFQIARAFRAGETGDRHNSEFTILEFYRVSNTVEAIMRDTEQLVARLTKGVVTLLGDRPPIINTRPPFRRLTLLDAFAEYASTSPEETLRLAEHDSEAFFHKLAFEVEPELAKLDHAVFITEYPASQASLARKKPKDPRVAERFELYVAGIELCNGFGELVDPKEQRQRLEHDQAERKRLGKPVYPIDERFLAALERGIPECAGNAIGFDRLVALMCGETAIRDVIAFDDSAI